MKRLLLLLVIFISFFLRLVNLENIPNGFTPDEASFGYDAYSIIETGRDQWGEPFPLTLKSFGDYKTPLQSYLQISFISLMGLNKLAVRLPNALLGAGSVMVLYFLLKEIGKEVGFKEKKQEALALIGSFLLCFSSWHIMMSRGAFEANLTTFLLPLGLFLFIRGLKKPRLLPLSFLAFGFNLFSYHSARFLTPIILLVFVFFYRGKIKSLGTKKFILPVLIFVSFFALMLISFSKGGGARISERSVMQGALEESFDKKMELVEKGIPYFVARGIHNKYSVSLTRFINNYSQYLSIKFLFTEGPAESTYGMIPGRGVLYIFEGLLFLGIILLKKRTLKILVPFIIWLFLSFVPAALSSGVGYSANRTVIALPAVQIILAFSTVVLSDFLKSKMKKKSSVLFISFGIVIAICITSFVQEYFSSAMPVVAKGMLQGNLETAEWLTQLDNKEIEIQISRKLSEPHIYIAFAAKMDPSIYQEYSEMWDISGNNVNWVDQIPEYELDRYIFKNIDWPEDSLLENRLFIGRPDEFPENIETEMVFEYPDGEDSIYVVKLD